MQRAILIFVCLGIPNCFAQKVSMAYFYNDRCKDAIPDFAALAVLEHQSCPSASDGEILDGSHWSPAPFGSATFSCTSSYRIIRVLNSVTDTLNKKSLKVKERPVLPNFRHRPMLIFGNYKDGMIQIEKYEEMREYFDPFTPGGIDIILQDQRFVPIMPSSCSLYALHSIGTPYYNVKDLDYVDTVFYNKFLIPYMKQYVEYAGKDFNKLWQRLNRKRGPIKAAKIKNGFAALGAILDIRPIGDPQKTTHYELEAAIETVFKNDARIDTAIVTATISRNRLPFLWDNVPPSAYLREKPFYIFGNFKNGRLAIDSLASTLDLFVFEDTAYDISMGLPLKELFTYFLPPNISFEEFESGKNWNSLFPSIRNDALSSARDDKNLESFAANSERMKNAIKETTTRWAAFFDNKRIPTRETDKHDKIGSLFTMPVLEAFRCRRHDGHVPPQGFGSDVPYSPNEPCECHY